MHSVVTERLRPALRVGISPRLLAKAPAQQLQTNLKPNVPHFETRSKQLILKFFTVICPELFFARSTFDFYKKLWNFLIKFSSQKV